MPIRTLSLAVVLFAVMLPAQGQSLALTGATLVDGTGADPVERAVVLVRDGRIRCAGTADDCPVPEDARVVEIEGRYITPGLVDAHVHYSQTGWADGRPDSLDVRERYPYPEVIAALQSDPQRWHRSHLCSGITAVFDVGGYPWTWRLREEAHGNPMSPNYAAAGPLLTTLDHWLNLPAERQFIYLGDESDVAPALAYLTANESDAAKLWFINTGERQLEVLEALATKAGEAARAAGLPFIVHATGLEQARIAVAAGAGLLVHSVDDAPVDEELIEAMKANDTIYTPTLMVGSGYYRMHHSALKGQAPEVDDPNGCVDAQTLAKVRETATLDKGDSRPMGWIERYRERLDSRRETMARNLEALNDAGVPVATGTDAGNPLTLHGPAIHAEMEAMQAAGMDPMEVIVASTRNGAKAMGRLDEFGTVEPGKAADLLVLGADPTRDVAHFRALQYIMRAGVLHPQEQLRAGR